MTADREQAARDTTAYTGDDDAPDRLPRGEAWLMIITLSLMLWIGIVLVVRAFV